MARAHEVVVIRRANDADLPLLHDLAELDSSAPLAGPALVAVVDGRPWAGLALDSGHVVADPFLPTAAAVGLLRLRAQQLDYAAHGRVLRRALPRSSARRARA